MARVIVADEVQSISVVKFRVKDIKELGFLIHCIVNITVFNKYIIIMYYSNQYYNDKDIYKLKAKTIYLYHFCIRVYQKNSIEKYYNLSYAKSTCVMERGDTNIFLFLLSIFLDFIFLFF